MIFVFCLLEKQRNKQQTTKKAKLLDFENELTFFQNKRKGYFYSVLLLFLFCIF